MTNCRLLPKQERFCHEYVVDVNATQAAIRAGYSPKSAHVQASRLLSKANVAQRVEELKAEGTKRLDVRSEDVIGMLLASYTDAKADRQHGPAVRAAELLGKRLGMFIDRAQLELRQMSDDDLIRELRKVNPGRADAIAGLLGTESAKSVN